MKGRTKGMLVLGSSNTVFPPNSSFNCASIKKKKAQMGTFPAIGTFPTLSKETEWREQSPSHCHRVNLYNSLSLQGRPACCTLDSASTSCPPKGPDKSQRAGNVMDSSDGIGRQPSWWDQGPTTECLWAASSHPPKRLTSLE